MGSGGCSNQHCGGYGAERAGSLGTAWPKYVHGLNTQSLRKQLGL
jgi:hypothetical protein